MLANCFNNLSVKFIHMRIVEDKYGNRFLEIESKEDFEKFKEDLLKIVREKAKLKNRVKYLKIRHQKMTTSS